MDSGIWATWYDVASSDRGNFLEWMDHVYLPSLAVRPGHAWVAHYELTGGGKDMAKLGGMLARPEADGVAAGGDLLLLVGAASPHVFFQADAAWRLEGVDTSTEQHLAKREGVRTAIFAEEARVTGPETARGVSGGLPGPAIQMGSFRMQRPEDEFILGSWYAQYRLPAMARMPGVIGTRKLVCTAGWANHGILYEFTSLEDRLRHFEEPHEALALDEKEWTGRIVRRTVHTPGSPSIGRRIWPAE